MAAGRTCSVSMMYQETRFRYRFLPEDGVQLLEMPYRGDDITMVIVLPSQGTPLSQVSGGPADVLEAGLMWEEAAAGSDGAG